MKWREEPKTETEKGNDYVHGRVQSYNRYKRPSDCSF